MDLTGDPPLALEGVPAWQKTAQGRWILGGHQLNAPRQGDHLQALAWAEAELLAHPLGNHDLKFRRDGREIHG